MTNEVPSRSAGQYTILPVGMVHRRGQEIWIEIFAPYEDAMKGVENFSHILVLFWFHENDQPEKRAVLQVHPRKDPRNPLTGVFGTHSSVRPNLIGLTRCRILAVKESRIYLEAIDAIDGSPVIDIKCFIPDQEPLSAVHFPSWV